MIKIFFSVTFFFIEDVGRDKIQCNEHIQVPSPLVSLGEIFHFSN